MIMPFILILDKSRVKVIFCRYSLIHFLEGSDEKTNFRTYYFYQRIIFYDRL